MSLDIWLTKLQPVDIFSANYTHNVIPMWKEAGVFEVLYESQGRKARDIVETLKKGVDHMRDNPAIFINLNPKNGWGSYETALPWLQNLVEQCLKNPDAEIHISS